MIKFTIISDEIYAVKNAGYKLDWSNGSKTEFDFGNTDYSENKQGDIIDSFYDLDNARLCKDESGDCFAVYFDLVTKEPLVWQKVVKYSVALLREQSNLSLAEFSRFFEIPYKTCQKWNAGERQCPLYLLKLMEFKLQTLGLIK